MTPLELQTELRRRDLAVLGVGEHRSDANVAVVYLHGARGQWHNGEALRRVAEVPGVKRVAESVRTPAIILAWLD